MLESVTYCPAGPGRFGHALSKAKSIRLRLLYSFGYLGLLYSEMYVRAVEKTEHIWGLLIYPSRTVFSQDFLISQGELPC